VSWVALPSEQISKPERKGLEVDLISAYRATVGENPTCQFQAGDRGDENDEV
jgi:hypothetical protein